MVEQVQTQFTEFKTWQNQQAEAMVLQNKKQREALAEEIKFSDLNKESSKILNKLKRARVVPPPQVPQELTQGNLKRQRIEESEDEGADIWDYIDKLEEGREVVPEPELEDDDEKPKAPKKDDDSFA
eukprot:TRINITY_DN27808_c0_g1_i1.p1 TRINITY_DN27808_c0_g1~~TRINITY_DN27808_c0_g1_i1.p1  ORF type:complete len:146 (-),score=60.96 TRINITY_DN27808_c0_g1_i1:331-711(-)